MYLRVKFEIPNLLCPATTFALRQWEYDSYDRRDLNDPKSLRPIESAIIGEKLSDYDVGEPVELGRNRRVEQYTYLISE